MWEMHYKCFMQGFSKKMKTKQDKKHPQNTKEQQNNQQDNPHAFNQIAILFIKLLFRE